MKEPLQLRIHLRYVSFLLLASDITRRWYDARPKRSVMLYS